MEAANFRFELNRNIAKSFGLKKANKKEEAKLESFILTDINVSNINNYLNVSVHDNLAGYAPEAKLELHLPQKQGPDRHLLAMSHEIFMVSCLYHDIVRGSRFPAGAHTLR